MNNQLKPYSRQRVVLAAPIAQMLRIMKVGANHIGRDLNKWKHENRWTEEHVATERVLKQIYVYKNRRAQGA